MGDYHTQAMDDVTSGAECVEYTCDWFTCGLCGLRTSTIESYVNHMVLQEKCVLHLCPSRSVRDLLLPRFSKRRRRGQEEVEEVEDIKLGGRGVEVKETKVEVQAEEVELGDVRRWKCQVCGLTFSRQAAILNHFKLQHRVGVSGEAIAHPHHPEVKEEDPVAPIKHIVTVDTKEDLHSLQELKTHPDKAWKELGCHLCGQVFKTGKILRAHISVVHSEGRPYQCDTQGCSYSFKTKGSLKRHQRRHTGERPFACEQCGRLFRESGSLTRHLQSQASCVTKSDAQIPLYGRTLPLDQPTHSDRKPSIPPDLKFGLKQELTSAEDESSDFLPGITSSSVPMDESKAVLRNQIASAVQANHLVKVEESGVTSGGGIHATHPLPICKTEPPNPPATASPPSTSANVETNDVEGEEDFKPPHFLPDILRRSFTCPVCYKSYSRRPSLALHISQHLDDLGDQCSECQRKFSTRQALSCHLVTHSSLRQFECVACGKTFKLLSHARTHLLTHSDAKTVPCRYCHNVYKTKSARNTHERTHTSPPGYVCVVCQRAFTTKASLVRHLRTHSGYAPFSCRHCGRAFKEHGTLSRHLRRKASCSKQARMEKELGDVGIHLVSTNTQEDVKNENCADDTQDKETFSDFDLVSEGGSSVRESADGDLESIEHSVAGDVMSATNTLILSDESSSASSPAFLSLSVMQDMV